MTSFDVFLQALISGVLTGWLYALVAIGLTLIFGVMRVVNFAHGDFLMLGMYGTYVAFSRGGLDPGWSIFWLVLAMGGLGAVFYSTIVKHLVGKSELTSVAVTLGVGMLIQNVALMVFKGDNLVVSTGWANNSLLIGQIAIQWSHLIAAIASILLIGTIYCLLRFSDLGLKMRAVSQSQDGAALSGIDFNQVSLWTTIIGLGTLGVAAPLLMSILYVSPTVGVQFTLIAFVTVIAGGLGNFFGAVVVGVGVGVTERVAGIWLPASLAAAIPFALLIFVMLWRPQGVLVARRAS